MTRGVNRPDYGKPKEYYHNPKRGVGGRSGGRKLWEKLGISPEREAVEKIDKELAQQEKDHSKAQEEYFGELDKALDVSIEAMKAYSACEERAEALLQRAGFACFHATHCSLPEGKFLEKAIYCRSILRKAKRDGEDHYKISAEEKLLAAKYALIHGDADEAEKYYLSALSEYRSNDLEPHKAHEIIKRKIDEAKAKKKEEKIKEVSPQINLDRPNIEEVWDLRKLEDTSYSILKGYADLGRINPKAVERLTIGYLKATGQQIPKASFFDKPNDLDKFILIRSGVKANTLETVPKGEFFEADVAELATLVGILAYRKGEFDVAKRYCELATNFFETHMITAPDHLYELRSSLK